MSVASPTLVLRGVHVPPAPGWWPPAPGWWMVLLALLVLVVLPLAFLAWRRLRLRRWAEMFDAQCPRSLAPPAQVAAASELLRRAARRAAGGTDALRGEAWLAFLDGKQGHAFSQGDGRLLLDGGYRRHVDAQKLDALRELARVRFLQLMRGRA